MIVIYKNGERHEITGWREWLVWLAAGAIIVVLACLALGVALTLFTIAIFTIPLAFLFALVAGLVLPKR